MMMARADGAGQVSSWLRPHWSQKAFRSWRPSVSTYCCRTGHCPWCRD